MFTDSNLGASYVWFYSYKEIQGFVKGIFSFLQILYC
jgi:hypothetical protein